MRCFSSMLHPARTLLLASLVAACGCHSVGDRAVCERPVASGAVDPPPAAIDTAARINAVQTLEPPIESRARDGCEDAVRAASRLPTTGRDCRRRSPRRRCWTLRVMLPRRTGCRHPRCQLSDLENMALGNNPVIARATAQIRAAQGNWVQTGLPPNPRLGYVAEEMGSAGSAGMQGGFVGQQFVTSHKLALNRQIAAWQIQRAQQELEAERLRVLTDVRTAYYDVLIAQERRELAANLVGISEQAVQSAELLFKGEEVSEADPLRARVEAERARIVWENAEAQLLEAWRRLAAVTGVPDMQCAATGRQISIHPPWSSPGRRRCSRC